MTYAITLQRTLTYDLRVDADSTAEAERAICEMDMASLHPSAEDLEFIHCNGRHFVPQVTR